MRRKQSTFRKAARIRIKPRFFLIFFAFFAALSAGFFLLSNAQLNRQIPAEKDVVAVGDPVSPIAAEKTDEPDGEDGDDIPSGVTDVTLGEASVYVMIDPGHGGKDGGCYYGDLRESELNLAIALHVRDFLQARGIGVLMTRDTDVMVGESQSKGLYTRAMMSNRSNAVCFVSIHANAYSGDTSIHGIDTYRNAGANEKSEDLATFVQNDVIEATGAKDRGLKYDSELVVVREVKVPSALVEVGFFTNPEEFKNLSDDAYRKKIAQGITNGILDFLLQEGYVKEVSAN